MKLRPDRLTKQVLGDIGVRRGERVLAWAKARTATQSAARTDAGAPGGPAGSMNLLVATTLALYLPAEADGLKNWRRRSWDQLGQDRRIGP